MSATQLDQPISVGELTFPPRPKRSIGSRLLSIALIIVFGLAVWSMIALHLNPVTFIDGRDNAIDFLRRTVPFTFPDFTDLAGMIIQTLAIVVLATVLGLIISFPVALLAASNTSPHPAVRLVMRAAIVAFRSTPEFVIAMLLVQMFGLGGTPGVLALGLGSVGFMAKLFADAIEEVDAGPTEAFRAAGATKLQQIMGSVLAQVRPTLIATTLHAFDINLRGSVLLGFVGIAGIGMNISAALDSLNYPRGMGLTLVLLVMCLAAEIISTLIRRSILGRQQRASTSSGSRWLAVLTGHRTPRGWITGTARSSGAAAVRTRTTGSYSITEPWTPARIRRTAGTVLVFAIIVASIFGAGFEVVGFTEGVQSAWKAIRLYFPPTTAGQFPSIVVGLIETAQMGLAGTLFGLILAIPLGLLSANNVVRNGYVSGFFRLLVVTIRAVPGIIVGIVFVVITGLGATAGALALGVHAIGFFSKIIADSLEDVDIRVQDAVRTSGASASQVFFTATFRQVMPALAAHTMHQLDTNVRGATSMGVIGAGGIGFLMSDATRVLQYSLVTSCLIGVVALVLCSEGLAVWTRQTVK
ncbi:phosphonate ABC transporter, permease protein PhnE [Actinopolymorpha pittospori]|uniref:Phosphonate transport system permease protein n=1 Tax=Actinopolymorpha pittospori TaxID=648752 RepID=A0A927MV64_9ACTN|nr:phosphonate ABC transporter, permease protein PhnE [Actinopolymorpha pittospori]MBE1606986.1 phosphonate transport system permease protein [Actinopolymorpha pittospori]